MAKIDDRILVSQVEEARARASLAQETWERRRRLYEEDRVGSELAYLEARYASEQASAGLAALQQRLARTTIRAPFEGVLEDRFVEVGSMVSSGTPVARVVLDPLKIVAPVPERYAADVAPGARASVTFDVLEDQVFDGRIAYVASTVNPQSCTFLVEFTLANLGGAIKPQMLATLGVVRRVVEQTIVVPQEALVRVEEGYVAFVVLGEGDDASAQAKPVTLGPSQRNLAVVTEGLAPGDRLVVVGQQIVAHGDRVRVVEER